MKKIMLRNIVFSIMLILSFPAFADNDNSDKSIAGATNWSQFQGNAQHNGYVPITLNPSSFKLKWKTSSKDFNDSIFSGDVVTYNDRLLMVTAPPDMYQPETGFNLYSIDINTGNIVWEKSFSNAEYFSWENLAADNGKVFITYANRSSNGADQDTAQLTAYDINSGTIDYNNTLYAFSISSPVVSKNKVCAESSRSDIQNIGIHITCYDEDSGNFVWQLEFTDWGPLNQLIPEIPVISNGVLATLGASTLYFYNINNGKLIRSIQSSGYTDAAKFPLYIDDKMQNLINHTVDENTNRPAGFWQTNLRYLNNQNKITTNGYAIAIANGIIYQVFVNEYDTTLIQGISQDTGSVLWTTNISGANQDSRTYPIVTNNLLFVTTAQINPDNSFQSFNTTYAVDLVTHKIVWKYDSAALLALAQNTLFLKGDDNSLIAIGLNN